MNRTIHILFDFDSDALRQAARTNLSEFAESMKAFKESNVLVVGHTDAKGAEEYNQKLSKRRAAAATGCLTGEGMSDGRTNSVGRGERAPSCSDNRTPLRRGGFSGLGGGRSQHAARAVYGCRVLRGCWALLQRH
ncbi:MAG: OmpA family protein [Salinibacter sp.]